MNKKSTVNVKVTKHFYQSTEHVFDAWLDPTSAAQFLFKTPTGKMLKVDIDPKTGGAWTIIEQRGDVKAEHRGKYLTIDRPQHLKFSFGGPGFPDTYVTIDIKPLTKGCELTLTHEGVWSEYKEKTTEGWMMTLDTLSQFLKTSNTSDREIIVTRVINAPCERLWEAIADPDQVVKWWGPNGFTTTTQKREFKTGGVWEHVMHGPDGTDYPNKSVYTEISKPERMVYTHGGGKKDDTGANFISTWTLKAHGDQTKLTMHLIFATPQERDHVVNVYGAIEGGKQTLARLDEFVCK